jgi:hypothetical protein
VIGRTEEEDQGQQQQASRNNMSSSEEEEEVKVSNLSNYCSSSTATGIKKGGGE